MKSVISINPEVMHGESVFEGPRVPIATFFGCLEHGMSMREFLEQYSSVTQHLTDRLLEEKRAELALV